MRGGFEQASSQAVTLIEKYGFQIAIYAAAVFFNVFAGIYLAARNLFLKETGRKLAHI